MISSGGRLQLGGRGWSLTWTTALLSILLAACDSGGSLARAGSTRLAPLPPAGRAAATFAGGCFWCMERPFEELAGVEAVLSGYTGGHVEGPGYQQVCEGTTGHYEAIQVTYDPERIGYPQLLETFWRQVDPTDAGGQFVDRGTQYRAAIFVRDDSERAAAEASKRVLEASGRFDRPIVTAVLPVAPFFVAEEYHQDFYRLQPEHYHRYRNGSGRDALLRRIWGKEASAHGTPAGAAARPAWEDFQKPAGELLRARLTPMQYRVTQEEGTEPPFRNEFWDSHESGLFVDVVSGEPLFSSRDKYDSGTGWPSFTRPLDPGSLLERSDHRLGMTRVEVRSRRADSHLGHVFPDGPPPTGQRYCINSAALRFVPRSELEKEGYGRFAAAFEAPSTASPSVRTPARPVGSGSSR